MPAAKPSEGGRFSRQAFLRGVVAAAAPLFVVGVSGQQAALADNEIIEKMVADKIAAGWQEPEVTQKAFMDISIGGQPAGRLVINVSIRCGLRTRPRTMRKRAVFSNPFLSWLLLL